MSTNKRYIKLESVGSAFDKFTFEIMPLKRDGTISHGEKMHIDEADNSHFWEQLSQADVMKLTVFMADVMDNVDALRYNLNWNKHYEK